MVSNEDYSFSCSPFGDSRNHLVLQHVLPALHGDLAFHIFSQISFLNPVTRTSDILTLEFSFSILLLCLCMQLQFPIVRNVNVLCQDFIWGSNHCLLRLQ